MGDLAALAVGVALFRARLSSWDGKNQGSWKMVKSLASLVPRLYLVCITQGVADF